MLELSIVDSKETGGATVDNVDAFRTGVPVFSFLSKSLVFLSTGKSGGPVSAHITAFSSESLYPSLMSSTWSLKSPFSLALISSCCVALFSVLTSRRKLLRGEESSFAVMSFRCELGGGGGGEESSFCVISSECELLLSGEEISSKLKPLSEDAEEPVYESLSNSSCGTDESLRRESSSLRYCSSTALTPAAVGMLAVDLFFQTVG